MKTKGIKTLPTWNYPKGLPPIVAPKKAAPIVQPPAKKAPFGQDVMPTNAKKVTAATSGQLQKANNLSGRIGQGGKFKKHIGQ